MTRIEELRALAETTANAARLHPAFNSAWTCAHNGFPNLYLIVEERIMEHVGVRDTAKQEDKS